MTTRKRYKEILVQIPIKCQDTRHMKLFVLFLVSHVCESMLGLLINKTSLIYWNIKLKL